MVPISTALTNIACGFFVIACLLSPECWRSSARLTSLLWRHPACRAAFLLGSAMVATMTYTVASTEEALGWAMKYRKLFLLPLAVLAFEGAQWAPSYRQRWRVRWRDVICRAWLLVSTFVVLLSTANYLEITRIGPWRGEGMFRSWVFKDHIVAGMFAALLLHQAAHLAIGAVRRSAQAIFSALAVLAFLNAFVMLQGRTGQVLALLFVAWAVVRVVHRGYVRKQKGSMMPAVALAMVITIGAGVIVMTHAQRMAGAVTETQAYLETDAPTSVGLRVEWLSKAWTLVQEKPLLGYGMGGLGVEFAQLSEGKPGAAGVLTLNPHNEYALMLVQGGVLMLALFINLLIQIGRGAHALAPEPRALLGGWCIAFAIGCGANSLLLDFPQGHALMLLAGMLLGCARASEGDRR